MNRCTYLMLLVFSLILSEHSLPADSTAAIKPISGKGKQKMAFTITSAAFKNEGLIPKLYSCDGSDMSPELSWTGVPDSTKSFALICDDPDAPGGMWVHWVLFNLPAETRGLKEKVPSDAVLKNSAKHGVNSWGKFGYGGPCPPSGTHRYYFKLYALDTVLDLKSKVDKEQLLTAMKSHVLAQGELMGKYSRK